MRAVDEFIIWCLQHSDELGLRIRRFSWVQQWTRGCHDFEARIRLGGLEYRGRGSAFSEKEAVAKALAEAFERALLVEFGLECSNGLAAHPYYHLAESYATNEYYERHKFFYHFNKGAGLEILEDMPAEVSDQFPCLDVVNKYGIHLKVFTCHPLGNRHVVICAASGTLSKQFPFGILVGLGCAESFEDALVQSLFEVLRNLSAFIFGDIPVSLTISEFRKLKKVSVEAHRQLGLDIEYGGLIWQHMMRSVSKNVTPLAVPGVTVERLIPQSKMLSEVPLTFAFAHANGQNPKELDKTREIGLDLGGRKQSHSLIHPLG